MTVHACMYVCMRCICGCYDLEHAWGPTHLQCVHFTRQYVAHLQAGRHARTHNTTHPRVGMRSMLLRRYAQSVAL